jgi:hypothetical protein
VQVISLYSFPPPVPSYGYIPNPLTTESIFSSHSTIFFWSSSLVNCSLFL